MKNHKEPWQIAAARYCVDHSELGFEFKDLKEFVNKNYKVSDRHLEFFSKKKYSIRPDVNLVDRVMVETGCHH